MTTHQLEIQRRIKDNQLSDSEMQKYWAAYLNMARHNLFTTLMFITRSLGCLPMNEDATEEKIQYLAILKETLSPEDKLAPEDEEKARQLLLKHFPFLKIHPRTILKNKEDKKEELDPNESIRTFEDLKKDLRDIAYTLNDYRNRYSHSRYIKTQGPNILKTQADTEERCGKFLDNVRLIATRVIKERYKANKNSAQAGMIDENSFKFITEGIVAKNHATRKMEAAKDYYLSTLASNGKLSFFGKLFMTSILLEKKYATELLSQCHFLEAFDNNADAPKLSERRLILEVITGMRIRLPEKKLSVEKQDIQIALDILNELKKCPSEIFDLLGDEDKSLFNVVSDTGDTVLLKRHSDRFAQLALQYLDSSEAFKSLRFQVNAGKFRYLFRDEKHCVDGKTRPRVLEEPLNGYRRLMEFEKERTDKQSGEQNGLWEGFRILTEEESPRNDSTILPYITDSGARYLFDGDNIGISFGDYTPEIAKNENGRYKVIGKIADCIISKYELPALLFYHILATENGRKSVENVIKGTVINYRKLFTDIKEGRLEHITGENNNQLDQRLKANYNISLADIPGKLAEYLTGSDAYNGNRFRDWKKGLIENLISETENYINRLEKNQKNASSLDNKQGKKNYVYLKPGAYASFIAADIVFFQECEARKKMTGLNFKVMQSSLATFQERSNTSFEDLLRLFRNASLITENNGKGNHPFLYKVVARRSSDIIKFYEKYLSERKVYLEGDIPDSAIFLHSERKRWEQRNVQYYRDLAARYLERPIQLPRQLFENPIRQILLSDVLGDKGKDLKEDIQEAYDNGRCNVTFMILMYLYDYLDDSPQFFYGMSEGDLDYGHNYRFFSLIRKYTGKTVNIYNSLKYNNRKSRSNNTSLYLQALDEGVKWARNNPIPKTTTDRNSTRSAGTTLSEEELAIALKKAYKEMMENQKLIRRYAVQDAVLFLGAKKIIGNISKGDFHLYEITPQGQSILEQQVTVRTPYRNAAIVQENIKIKDYGKLYKLLHDKRVDDLLVQHKGEDVNSEDLTEEIAHYDRNRVGVFDTILKYEKKIANGKTDAELTNDKGRIDFLAIQTKDNQNSEEDKKKVRLIRNAFSHNQYPQDYGKPVYYDKEIPGAADEVSSAIKEVEKKTK